MSVVFTMPAPEAPKAASSPTEIIPMLIGATVGEVERELVLQTLARCDGNRTRAARVLGISVRTLRNKIREYAAEGGSERCRSYGHRQPFASEGIVRAVRRPNGRRARASRYAAYAKHGGFAAIPVNYQGIWLLLTDR